jgi:hypothetical protein
MFLIKKPKHESQSTKILKKLKKAGRYGQTSHELAKVCLCWHRRITDLRKSGEPIVTLRFENIKLLQQAGLSIAKVRSVTGRSAFSINGVFHTDSLQEMRVYNTSKRVKQTPGGGKPTKVAEDTDMVRFTNILENIDNRLKFLENNIVVSKRKFF